MFIEQTETEHYYRHLEHKTALQAKVNTITESLKCIGENMDPGRVNVFMDSQSAIRAIAFKTKSPNSAIKAKTYTKHIYVRDNRTTER